MSESDTIVAVATPAGRGGIAIVRLSGAAAFAIGQALAGKLPEARRAALREFRSADGQLLDFGVVLGFRRPASFTGEDVVELHGHGGQVIAASLVERCVELGARRAGPGEFSKRAYLNDKLDLAQAEAIAAAIDSGTRQAARAALRSLSGAFSKAVHSLSEQLTQLRMYVEAAIDFPEDEIDFLSDSQLAERIESVQAAFESLSRRARQGRLLTDGYQVVIVGAPNAGKSSLMNALTRADAAIVTAIPGTTRDLLRERIDLHGLPVELIDTAGFRSAPDAIEREGIVRARGAVATADHALVLGDATLAGDELDETRWRRLEAELPADLTRTRVLTKIDRTAQAAGVRTGGDEATVVVATSSLTEAGLQALTDQIRAAAGHHDFAAGSFSARQRHIEAIAEAAGHFRAGRAALDERRAGELMAEELRLAQRSLGVITGEVTTEDLLGRIFGEFCIGK